MKHKTYFYFVAVLLTFFIAFNACQEEIFDNYQQNKEGINKGKTITLEELRAELNDYKFFFPS